MEWYVPTSHSYGILPTWLARQKPKTTMMELIIPVDYIVSEK